MHVLSILSIYMYGLKPFISIYYFFLLISGLLGAVGKLVYHGNNKTLEWEEPLHLNTPDTISYKVVVVLIPDLSNDNTGHPDSNIELTTNNTSIDLTAQVDDHFSSLLSVRAVSVVGQSEAAVIQIPSTILRAHTTISEQQMLHLNDMKVTVKLFFTSNQMINH